MLLDRERVVRAALHRRVVRDDDAFGAADAADAGDDPRAGRLVVVHAERGERRELEERRARVDQALDAVAREQLARARVPLAGALRSAQARLGETLAQLRYEAAHGIAVASSGVVAGVGDGPEHGHARSIGGSVRGRG